MDPAGHGGGRFTVRADPAARVLVKTGPAAPLAREAAALRLLAGIAGVPALVAHDAGRLVTGLVPGAPRPPAELTPAALRALGARLAGVHAAARRPDTPGTGWPAPATTAEAYANGRRADALALAAEAGLRRTCPLPRAVAPFRPVHGDLVPGNLVWEGELPWLVDWEFWRWGDPAEDLAYLAVTAPLPPAALDAVLAAHADPAVAARVPSWRPLVALEAAAWWWREGRRDLARRLLAEPGISRPSGPSAPPPPAGGGRPG